MTAIISVEDESIGAIPILHHVQRLLHITA